MGDPNLEFAEEVALKPAEVNAHARCSRCVWLTVAICRCTWMQLLCMLTRPSWSPLPLRRSLMMVRA